MYMIRFDVKQQETSELLGNLLKQNLISYLYKFISQISNDIIKETLHDNQLRYTQL